MRLGPVSWVVTLTVAASTARAERWQDATPSTIGATAEWTNQVEAADLDGDGWVDLVFANGGDDDHAGTPEPQRVFRNLGNWAQAGPHFAEITGAVFGAAATRLSRVIRAGDLDGDGDLDLFVGGAHGTASGLFVRRVNGAYDDVSATNLPAGPVSLGDAELGDVDDDGDLDLVAVDWGGPPLTSTGGVRVWLNDGSARFTAAPADRLPATAIGWAWRVALVDVDDDGDLDVVVGCRVCDGAVLWTNDGTGRFTDASDHLPLAAGADDLEAIDLDGDGDLDLAAAGGGGAGPDTVLVNDGHGRFEDQTAAMLTGAANPAGSDDRALAFVDVDSDRDPDLIVGSASGPDRLLRNDGAAGFTVVDGALPQTTPGTLGLALADLDHDGRVDLVEARGEGEAPEIVALGAAANPPDTAVPVIRVLVRATRADRRVIARVHDRRSRGRPHDWRRVVIEPGGPGTHAPIAMRWMGEELWTATVPDEPDLTYAVCASDAAGNPFCAHDESLDPAADAGADAGTEAGSAGGCCSTGGTGATGARASAVPALLVAAILVGGRRRRTRTGASR
ncbi:MAG TPA: VCBS repeat-containing protein [Kofleriaceae bacterium]|nr:VCBS repeat-containing protein [Kofleriaceae bacterium]